MPTQIPKGGWDIKGTWFSVPKVNGGSSVLLCCPGCGEMMYLPHEIASDGTVSPSVECPIKKYCPGEENCIHHQILCRTDKCNWHQFIKLEGWNSNA